MGSSAWGSPWEPHQVSLLHEGQVPTANWGWGCRQEPDSRVPLCSRESKSPPTPRLKVLQRKCRQTHCELRGTPVSSVPSQQGQGPSRRDPSTPAENGHVRGLGEVLRQTGASPQWLGPGPLAALGGSAVVSAFAEAATAEEQFNLPPGHTLGLGSQAEQAVLWWVPCLPFKDEPGSR